MRAMPLLEHEVQHVSRVLSACLDSGALLPMRVVTRCSEIVLIFPECADVANMSMTEADVATTDIARLPCRLRKAGLSFATACTLNMFCIWNGAVWISPRGLFAVQVGTGVHKTLFTMRQCLTSIFLLHFGKRVYTYGLTASMALAVGGPAPALWEAIETRKPFV